MTALINFGRTNQNGSIHVEARLFSPEPKELVRLYLDTLLNDQRLQPGDLSNPGALASRCAAWGNEIEICLMPRQGVEAIYWVVCDREQPAIYQFINTPNPKR